MECTIPCDVAKPCKESVIYSTLLLLSVVCPCLEPEPMHVPITNNMGFSFLRKDTLTREHGVQPTNPGISGGSSLPSDIYCDI